MDSVTPVPAAKTKKPFAIASITLILSAILVFAEMISPYVRGVLLDLPFEYIFDFATVVSYLFVILCIFCVAVATFFKKSNIFLIVSLFTLGFAYVCFSMLDVSSVFDAWSSYDKASLILGYRAGLCSVGNYRCDRPQEAFRSLDNLYRFVCCRFTCIRFCFW